MCVPALPRSELSGFSPDVLSPESLKKLGSPQRMLSDEDLDMEQYHHTIRRPSSSASVRSSMSGRSSASGKRRTMKDVKLEAREKRGSLSSGSGESSPRQSVSVGSERSSSSRRGSNGRTHRKESLRESSRERKSSRARRASNENSSDRRRSIERSRDRSSKRSSRERKSSRESSRKRRNSGEDIREERRSSRSHINRRNSRSKLEKRDHPSRPKSLEVHNIEEEDEVTLRASKSTPNLVIESGSRSSSEKSSSPSDEIGNVTVANCNGNFVSIYLNYEAHLIYLF